MKMLRLVPLLGLVLFLPHRAAAQAQNVAPQLPGCSWKCYSVTLPYGLYVKEVVDGGHVYLAKPPLFRGMKLFSKIPEVLYRSIPGKPLT